MNIDKDPVTNAIYNGIKRGIRTPLDAEWYGSLVVLLYAGMDAVSRVRWAPMAPRSFPTPSPQV